MTDIAARVSQLERQEAELVLPSFDAAAAYRLGTDLMARIYDDQLRVSVDIRRGDFIVFRGVGPRCTPDQQRWIDKKARVTLRMEASSALVAARMQSWGVDPGALGWLDPREYALTGGAFPVRVSGVGVVAVITASGLSSDDDHELVVAGIRHHLDAIRR